MHAPTSVWKSITVTAGTTSTPYILRSGIQSAIRAIPGNGGTMVVQYSLDPPATVSGGGGTWDNWPNGTVSANSSDSLLGRITAVKATATTADGTLQILE